MVYKTTKIQVSSVEQTISSNSYLSSGVVGEHNLDLESDNTLSEHNVSDGGVDVLSDWVTGVDHETVSEFHGLGSLTSQFTRDDDLTTLNEKSLRI